LDLNLRKDDYLWLIKSIRIVFHAERARLSAQLLAFPLRRRNIGLTNLSALSAERALMFALWMRLIKMRSDYGCYYLIA